MRRDRITFVRWTGALVLVLTSAASAAVAADLDFDRLSIEDGLSQSIVEQVVQDRTGFMWFVTEDGLNRFDGYRFTVYRNDPDDPSSLSHNELKTVFQDRSGAMWVGAFSGGLNRFDPETEQVIRYRHDPDDPGSLAADTVRCIFEDSAGRLWIGTQGGGLDLFDRNAGVFIHHRAGDSGLASDDIRAISEDRDGTLWIGTNGGGLSRLTPDTGSVSTFRHDPAVTGSLSHDAVFALLEDRAGTLWVGTYGGGLDAFDRSSGRFISHGAAAGAGLGGLLVRSLCEDHLGSLWVGTDGGGLSRLNRSAGTFETWRNDPLNPRSLSTDRVFSVYEDRSRVLWVGTYGGGLNRVEVGRERFRHFRHDPDDPNSLGDDIVWSFHTDRDGLLWVGTDAGGLNGYDPLSGRWRQLHHDPARADSLSHDTVRAVLEDRDGAIWAATHGGGLNRLDRRTGRFTRFRHDPTDPSTLGVDSLRSITQDRSGKLWIGTFGGGLDRLDPTTGSFEHFRHDPRDHTSLSHDFIRLVVEDREGLLWVGTQGGGLNLFDPQNGRCIRYRHDPENPSSLANDHVFAILEAGDGSMWIGTYGGGLDRMDRETGEFHHFTEADGLVSNSVYAVLEDESGRLWISTNRGLSRFDPADNSFRTFDTRDGLQSNEFNGGSAFKDASGEMFFGGINGFNSFFPAEIASNPVVPKLVVTELRLFNRPVVVGEDLDGRMILDRSISATDRIMLSHHDRVFSLEFAALHYSAPGRHHYAYTLEGFADEWIQVDARRRFATFTGLAPGSYVFRVRGSNGDGLWSEEDAVLHVVVSPPFWATWWFRLLMASLAVALGALVLGARIRGVRMMTELEAAHDAQMAIMPQVPPEVPGLDVAGVCLPASEVGGDFFDFFRLEGASPRLCVVVGDVAGKGMKAAITAVMSDGMVFSRARQGSGIEETMNSLNRSLHLKVETRMFTALCLVVVDVERRELTFSNAGLCEPLLRSTGSVSYLSSPGSRYPLGAIESAVYECSTVPLKSSDVVVLFTDGVPEARHRHGELYGYDEPRELLERLNTDAMTATQIRDAVVAHVRSFSGGSRQSDDMAVVVLKFT